VPAPTSHFLKIHLNIILHLRLVLPLGFPNKTLYAHHPILSRARSIQSMPPTSHYLKIHLNSIIPSTSGSSLRFPRQNTICTSPSPLLILLHWITRIIFVEELQIIKLPNVQFSPLPVTSSLVGSIFSSAHHSQTASPYVPPHCERPSLTPILNIVYNSHKGFRLSLLDQLQYSVTSLCL
jgi:hypothetical protein